MDISRPSLPHHTFLQFASTETNECGQHTNDKMSYNSSDYINKSRDQNNMEQAATFPGHPVHIRGVNAQTAQLHDHAAFYTTRYNRLEQTPHQPSIMPTFIPSYPDEQQLVRNHYSLIQQQDLRNRQVLHDRSDVVDSNFSQSVLHPSVLDSTNNNAYSTLLSSRNANSGMMNISYRDREYQQDGFQNRETKTTASDGMINAIKNSGECDISPNAVFCHVPGRLSLLSSTSKYKVTVAEVERRLSSPERLNASLLGGVLRRAKSKNGGKCLREKLEKYGLTLPAGRRKTGTVTLMTSLVEGEAIHLARDFDNVTKSHFPVKKIAQHIRKKHVVSKQAMMAKVEVTLQLVKEFEEVICLTSSPNGHDCTTGIENDVMMGLRNFSLVSHEFGLPAIKTAIDVFHRYLQELQECQEKESEDDQNTNRKSNTTS